MNYLQDLACTIGWTLVNDDEGFSVYEFKQSLNKYESISHIVKIYDKPTEVELFDILQSLKKVLPRKLNKKIDKILKNVKIEDLANVVDVVSFAVEEYVAKTDFSKLKEYGELVGVNIEDLGYKFKYKLSKKRNGRNNCKNREQCSNRNCTRTWKNKKDRLQNCLYEK